jgi:hypothetical protein
VNLKRYYRCCKRIRKLWNKLGCEPEDDCLCHRCFKLRTELARKKEKQNSDVAVFTSGDFLLKKRGCLKIPTVIPKSKKQLRKERRAAWWKEYEEYIHSPRWHDVRKNKIEEAGNKCEDCGATEVILHCHHKHYGTLKRERNGDLELLCVPCHQKRHPKKRIR